MTACNLFRITDILPCNLFNIRILAFYLHFSNIISSEYIAYVNHLPEDDHCRPEHVGLVSYLKKTTVFYYCVVVEIDIVM